MKEDSADRLDKFAMMNMISARNMASSVISALSKNEIKKETALELLDGIREQMANAYNQRIEIFQAMGLNPKSLITSKTDELASLDEAVCNFTDEKSVIK